MHVGLPWVTLAQLLPELSHEEVLPVSQVHPRPSVASPDPRHLRSSCCSLQMCLAPNLGVKMLQKDEEHCPSKPQEVREPSDQEHSLVGFKPGSSTS